MIIVYGDRQDRIVRLARVLQKKIFKNLIKVVLWDGYKTTFAMRRSRGRGQD